MPDHPNPHDTSGLIMRRPVQVTLSSIGKGSTGAQNLVSLSISLTNLLSQPIVIPWTLGIQNDDYQGEVACAHCPCFAVYQCLLYGMLNME